MVLIESYDFMFVEKCRPAREDHHRLQSLLSSKSIIVEASETFAAMLHTFKKALRVSGAKQGCQIFLGTIYQKGGKYTKVPQNMPNVHKIYQMAAKYNKWP
jgi:hypothetical protein